jgi:hypothetical protein
MNRDAAAARLAFITGLGLGVLGYYTPEATAYVQATPELIDSVQKILYGFAVGFTLLFTIFLSRSIALRSRRKQHDKDRALLRQLEETMAEWREKLNESFTQLEAHQREILLLNENRELLKGEIQKLLELLEESYV